MTPSYKILKFNVTLIIIIVTDKILYLLMIYYAIHSKNFICSVANV